MQEAVERESSKKDVSFEQKRSLLVEHGLIPKSPPSVDPADVVLIAQEFRVCLECGEPLRVSNDELHEYVCSNPACGHVWGSEAEEAHIPFDADVSGGHSEGSYSPITHLEFGGGLGSKVDTFLAADVLGDCGDMPEEVRKKLEEEILVTELLTGKRPNVKNGKFRSPFALSRASHAQVPLTNSLLRELLTFGADFCKKQGFHRSRDKHHIWFSDQVGINLIHVGRFYASGKRKLWSDPWRVAASIFCILFREVFPERYNSIRFGNSEEAEKKYPELCLDDVTLEYFGKILATCNPPILPALSEGNGHE